VARTKSVLYQLQVISYSFLPMGGESEPGNKEAARCTALFDSTAHHLALNCLHGVG
jgi:hypothetical protein